MNTERILAEGVCDSIRHATPNFHWKPRRGHGHLAWVAVAALLVVFALAAFASRAHAL